MENNVVNKCRDKKGRFIAGHPHLVSPEHYIKLAKKMKENNPMKNIKTRRKQKEMAKLRSLTKEWKEKNMIGVKKRKIKYDILWALKKWFKIKRTDSLIKIKKNKIKRINPLIGRKLSPATIIKRQEARDYSSITGKFCHLWKGGKCEPYGPAFNKKLKEQIRKRDGYRCQQCFRLQDELRTKTNKSYKLNVHHIDFNKKNNLPQNLISLCKVCHAQTNFNREEWTNYFQEKVLIYE